MKHTQEQSKMCVNFTVIRENHIPIRGKTSSIRFTYINVMNHVSCLRENNQTWIKPTKDSKPLL